MDINELKDLMWKWELDHPTDEELRKLFGLIEETLDDLCNEIDELSEECEYNAAYPVL